MHRQALAGASPDVEDHASAPTQVAYGQLSAIKRLLILNAEPDPGRGTVLLLREPSGSGTIRSDLGIGVAVGALKQE